MKNHTLFCALDTFALVFVAIALILTSFIAGQVVHEQTHLHQVIDNQHHSTQVCYFGVYNLNTFSWMQPFVSGWVAVEDYSNPYIPLDEKKPYLYGGIATIICLLLSLICWIRLKLLMEDSSRLRALAKRIRYNKEVTL